MRQTFTFAESTHKPQQALAALKNRVRKYVKRERRKALPEGVDYWDFDCKIGETEQTATDVHISEVTNLIEAVFDAGDPTVYVQIISKPGVRKSSGKPVKSSPKSTPKSSRDFAKPSKGSSKSKVEFAKTSKGFSKPVKESAKANAKPFKRSSEPSQRSEKPVKDTANDDRDDKPSSSWSFG